MIEFVFQDYCLISLEHHLNACVLSLESVRLSETLWTIARKTALSLGFSQQEYLIGLLFPPPTDLPDPKIKLISPEPAGDSLPLVPPRKPTI